MGRKQFRVILILTIISLVLICLVGNVYGEAEPTDADVSTVEVEFDLMSYKLDQALKSYTLHYEWTEDQTDYATGTWATRMAARVE